MDTNQNTPVSDDQELANVLAGMNQQAAATDDQAAGDLTVIDPPKDDTAPLGTPELKFEEAPMTPIVAGEEDKPAEAEDTAPVLDELPAVETPALETPTEEVVAPAETPAVEPTTSISPLTPSLTSSSVGDLDDIKKDALDELRPLVDKLDLPADEKFDTILLIIRSTDDKSLVNAAHEAARAIPDEGKRAQALLDVIKEIDYFSGHGENPAA